MKLEKSLKALFIVFMISLCSIQTNCMKSTLSRKLLKSKSKAKNTVKNSSLWSFIKNKIFGEENILYFALGFLSAFNNYFSTLYTNIQPVIHKYKPCVTSIIDTFKLVAEKMEETVKEQEEFEKNQTIIDFLDQMKDQASQKEYCKKVKAENVSSDAENCQQVYVLKPKYRDDISSRFG